MKSNVLVLIPVVSAVEHQRDARPNQQNTQMQTTAELDYHNGGAD